MNYVFVLGYGTQPVYASETWGTYELVMDIPEESTRLFYTADLRGPGQLWVDNFSIEIVDDSVGLWLGPGMGTGMGMGMGTGMGMGPGLVIGTDN